MIALSIDNISLFMNKFLNSETFDTFYVEKAVITTYNRFEISGRTTPGFYSDEEIRDNPSILTEFSPWSLLRPICFNLIKGKRTPLSFQFILHAGDSFKLRLIQNSGLEVDPSLIKSLTLMVRYENNTLTCITGTSFTTFVLDRSLESTWDDSIRKSFVSMSIPFTEHSF